MCSDSRAPISTDIEIVVVYTVINPWYCMEYDQNHYKTCAVTLNPTGISSTLKIRLVSTQTEPLAHGL